MSKSRHFITNGNRWAGWFLAVCLVVPMSARAVRLSDPDYAAALLDGEWASAPVGTVSPRSGGDSIGWAVRDDGLYLQWPVGDSMQERRFHLQLRRADTETAANAKILNPTFHRRDRQVRMSGAIPAWGLKVDTVLIPRNGWMEGAVRLRTASGEDLPLRIEAWLVAGDQAWRWWEDPRRSQDAAGDGVFANTTRVLAGLDGTMSRYPLACLTRPGEGLVMAVPLMRPRVFQLRYDGSEHSLGLSVDLAVSPSTDKFPSEASFFFSLYPTDPSLGFRGALAKYMTIYPEGFVKRAEREGVWMPFTRINDVQDAQDFHFGFHEYGAVDFAYNQAHGIYSFLYVEPWTYWMAMAPDVPRETATAMQQLRDLASGGDAWNRNMARATLQSAVYNPDGKPSHQFVDQPWCSGTLFFNNADPDIDLPGYEGLNMGQLNMETARKGVVERSSLVIEGWDAFADGYNVDRNVSHDGPSGSIRLDRTPESGDRGAVQVVTLRQDQPRPVWIRAWSRADAVAEGAAVNYSLYADVTYRNGSNSWGHAVGFDSGTHNWQAREVVILPEAPIESVKVHLLLRGERHGTAWFDNVELKELPTELGSAVLPGLWEPYLRGFSRDEGRPYEGRYSARIDRGSAEGPGGALIRIHPNQEKASDLLIHFLSRTEGVSAQTGDADLGLVADIYFTDGSADYGVSVPATPGAAWSPSAFRYQPGKPVRSINLHLLMQGPYTGTVWFDAVSVADAETGQAYIQDEGFERTGSAGHEDELAALPNRIRDGAFTGDVSDIRSDGMYLDSMEGWANRLNFRREHFASVDVPLVYETGTGRTAIFNLFSNFEFTQAMADYLHAHDRLLMGNWVLIDYPFLGALLDVPGKEVHWLNSEHVFSPDPDAVMLYRRAMSGTKPYPLLLNVRFEHFTPEMMVRFFHRSMFYAFYPGMFSHDAASNPYFENPDQYNCDRHLFLDMIPMVRTLSRAGWEPVTHAACDEPDILVERYGSDPASGLYVAVHHDGEGRTRGTVTLDLVRMGVDGDVRLLDLADGSPVEQAGTGGTVSTVVQLGSYRTRILQVLPTTPEAAADVVNARADAVRATMARHLEQGKIDEEKAAGIIEMINAIRTSFASGKGGKASAPLTALQSFAAVYGHADLLKAVHALENAVATAELLRLGWRADLQGDESLVSPSDGRLTLILHRSEPDAATISRAVLSGDSIRPAAPIAGQGSTTDIPGNVSDRTDEIVIAFPYSLPGGIDPGAECLLRIELVVEMNGTSIPLVLNRRAGVMTGFDLSVSPSRVLSTEGRGEWRMEIHNRLDTPAAIELTSRLEGPRTLQPSWRHQSVNVPAHGSRTVTLEVADPPPEKPERYKLSIQAFLDTRLIGEAAAAWLRYPAFASLAAAPEAEVKVDSTFAGYSPSALHDGIVDTAGLNWSEAAWASAELAVPHWVEIRWPDSRNIRGMVIHWAEDGGGWFVSTNYRLQVRRDGQWVDLSGVTRSERPGIHTHTFPVMETDGVRLWQEAGGGPESRPDLLWIRELEVEGE